MGDPLADLQAAVAEDVEKFRPLFDELRVGSAELGVDMRSAPDFALTGILRSASAMARDAMISYLLHAGVIKREDALPEDDVEFMKIFLGTHLGGSSPDPMKLWGVLILAFATGNIVGVAKAKAEMHEADMFRQMIHHGGPVN